MDLHLGQELGICYLSKESLVGYMTILIAWQVVLAQGGTSLRLGFLLVFVGGLHLSRYITSLCMNKIYFLFFIQKFLVFL